MAPELFPSRQVSRVIATEEARIRSYKYSWQIADYTLAGQRLGRELLLGAEWSGERLRVKGSPSHTRFQEYLANMLVRNAMPKAP